MIATRDRFAPESLDDYRERDMTERERRIARLRHRRELLDEDDTAVDDEPLFRCNPYEEDET
jgi:hypothetical protein